MIPSKFQNNLSLRPFFAVKLLDKMNWFLYLDSNSIINKDKNKPEI
jgi:hypothetical protein